LVGLEKNVELPTECLKYQEGKKKLELGTESYKKMKVGIYVIFLCLIMINNHNNMNVQCMRIYNIYILVYISIKFNII